MPTVKQAASESLAKKRIAVAGVVPAGTSSVQVRQHVRIRAGCLQADRVVARGAGLSGLGRTASSNPAGRPHTKLHLRHPDRVYGRYRLGARQRRDTRPSGT
jgi:hypothetical protein